MSQTTLEEPQEIIVGCADFNRANFKSNYVRTTKYTPLTFLPTCLFSQLRRYANFYFVLVAVLTSIPQFSPLSPVSAWAPLFFVLGVSIIRESFEDLARYKADLETNSVKTQVQVDGTWKEIEAKDLYVGDIIKVTDYEHFPADVVALATSEPGSRFCVLSSSLTGDKDLKVKQPLPETQELIGDSDQFVLMGTFRFEYPNDNIHSFKGSLAIGERPIPISIDNLLIRGTMLKNTDWVIGLVTYASDDSKIRQHNSTREFKQSKVELLANWMTFYLLLFIIFLAIVVLIGAGTWNSRWFVTYTPFVATKFTSGTETFLNFMASLVLFSGILPVALILVVEVVKLVQAFFINKDQDMMDMFSGRFSRTFNSLVNEDLGMVRYVLADKTGTLTTNMLEFRTAFIGDTLFGDAGFLEGKRDSRRKVSYVSRREGITYAFHDRRLTTHGRAETVAKNENFVFTDTRDREVYRCRNQRELIENTLLAMATCHNCEVLDDNENRGKIKYSGVSQDDICVVDAARHMGFAFRGSGSGHKTVLIDGESETLEVLHFFEFDSERKRSSIILRHDGFIKHFVKGSGEEIGGRLNTKVTQPYLEKTEEMVDQFSLAGLRTICFGMKVLTLEAYKQMEARISSARQRGGEAAVRELADSLETDFILLGCVGIEDKLQERVAETIADLRTADIRVWMATGDKLEVAESVAYGCGLLDKTTKKLYIRDGDNLDAKYSEVRQALDHKRDEENVSLVLDGVSLEEFGVRADIAAAFCQDIFPRLNSLIGCRMSPADKGILAKTLKEHTGEVVLAIGDGANDVQMIQMASVGVGVYGVDGAQAIQASDFGVVSFKCLWKLLFVHGHWSYIRVSELLLFFYYKNLLFVVPQFLFCFFNGWSAQTLFDDYYIVLFHLLFTAVPLIARGAFDQNVYYKKWTSKSKTSLLENKNLVEYKLLRKFYPRLYYVGQQNTLFRWAH